MAATGEVFLSTAFQVAIEHLTSLNLKEFGSKLKIDKDLWKLKMTLSKIHAVLNDAEAKQTNCFLDDEAKQMNSFLVRDWLGDLEEVGVDDLVDEVATRAFLFSQQKKQVSNWIDKFDKGTFVNRLQEICERLGEIGGMKEELGLVKGVKSTFSEMGENERLTISSVDETDVFGRNGDKDRVAKLLMSDEQWRNDVFFGVVPIVGLGGLGKTTLAQLVYNDEFVGKHFELKTWICVSDDFDPQRLTTSIIESISNNSCNHKDLDVLQNKLRDLLRGKKFLLVLDDVWNEEERLWELLRPPFSEGAPGSRIIVTTRSEKVAKIMSPIQPYNLEVLSEDDCWLLFKKRAFPDGHEDAYPHLVPIGKKILKKCQGLPLAAKTLGGLLRDKREFDEWNMILKSEIWDLQEKNGILPALRLSYNNLPTYLKQCFMYCSIFPKDYNFDKENLVLLWMAEGFVQSKGKQNLEKVASKYFNDLWQRSFFQKSKTDSAKFVMHDLIHDLAKSVAGEICCSLEGEELPSNAGKVRHLSVLVNTFKSVGFDVFRQTKGLRTMLFLSNKNPHENANITVPDDLVSTLKCLRSWDLSYISIKELPDEIGNLIHIRYLDLSHTHISKLPESTCCLYNLQTLILIDCNKLLCLPEGTQELIKLLHLNLPRPTGPYHHQKHAATDDDRSPSPTPKASDALPLPLYLTNAIFFTLFFSVAYYLLHRWRDKIRNSTPLHVVTLSEIAAIVSLIASFIYLLGFFGIDFVQSFITRASHDAWDLDDADRNYIINEDHRLVTCPPANLAPVTSAPPKSPNPPEPTVMPLASVEDEEIVKSVVSGEIPSYSLESKLGDCMRAAMIRREALQRMTGRSLEGLPLEGFDYKSILGQCCEMPVGYVQIPVGIAGPLLLDGLEYSVPMATTEGCLVASTNRGCKAIYLSGGATSMVLRDGMTRAPVVRFGSAKRASELKFFLESPDNFDTLAVVFNRSSRFARLQGIQCSIAGKNLYIRFTCSTGDAMGMNMVSKGVQNVLEFLQTDFPDMEVIGISGNYCSDKKPAAVNWIEGRGKSVVCEALIKEDVVSKVLKTKVVTLVELNMLKNLAGSAVAGALGGFNAHASNIVSAIFIATGQDPAQNVESSHCITMMEAVNDGKDLHISVTMPSIEVGTVGGGTQLASQCACLNLLGVKGASKDSPGSNSRLLASVVAASVLAGELSLMSAIAAGQLVRSHMKYNRSSKDISKAASQSEERGFCNEK